MKGLIKMNIINSRGWVFYINGKPEFDPNKIGKWMYFFKEKDKEFATQICKKAIEEKIVLEAKHTADEILKYKGTGVACFYIHYDDIDAHKRVLSFFLKNELVLRTKKGHLYDISFKLDNQTLNGQYGNDFSSEIKLSKFIDLESGKWLI